jgi:nucleotide-binding universal stress UspA family protein
VHGAPGPALVDVSKNAGLLVLGTGGVQPEGPGVGSTAFYCLSHALCPVLVVPALEYLLLARQEPYAEARPPEVALTH